MTEGQATKSRLPDAPDQGASRLKARICLERAAARHEAARWCEALQWLDAAQGLVSEDPVGMGLLQARRSLVCLDLGRLTEAVQFGEEALRVLCRGKGPANGDLLDELVWSGIQVWVGVALALREQDNAKPKRSPGPMPTGPCARSGLWLQWLEPLTTARTHTRHQDWPRALTLLVETLKHPPADRLTPLLARLAAAEPSATESDSAQHWYWLAEAYRTALLFRSAESCLRAALNIASKQAMHALAFRAQRSLVSMLRAESRWGDACEVYTGMLSALMSCGLSVGEVNEISTIRSAEHVSPLQKHSANPQPVSRHVQIAMQVLSQANHLKLSVAELAHHCGVSRRTLEKAIAAECGITALRFIAQARMERLKTLIRSGVHARAQLASTLGYVSQTAMSRDVKRASGRSIREFVRAEKDRARSADAG